MSSCNEKNNGYLVALSTEKKNLRMTWIEKIRDTDMLTRININSATVSQNVIRLKLQYFS